jgi:hypothetical protein
MAFNNNITPGAPPLLWSNIYDAFALINENFDSLVATVGDGSGLTPIDFSTLDTDVSPSTDNLYSLGASDYVWRAVYAGGYVVDTQDAGNGVWIGAAQIKGIGAHVDIPAGSTIDGALLIDPTKTFFKTINVDGGNSIEAQMFGDNVNLLSGSGISMLVGSGADSITFSNTGILSIAAAGGISVVTVSGTTTVTNTGVLSLTSSTALPAGRTVGAGININNSTGSGIRITNTGILSVSSGVGITVSADAASGDVTITNSAPAQNTFTQIQVNGDTVNRILADSVTDVLNINSGQGITLTKDTVTDTLTFTVNPVFDLKGSIFGDDLSLIVDAVENKVYGGIFATTLRTSETSIALGNGAGIGQGDNTVAVGDSAGATAQGTNAVSVGLQAGQTSQGAHSVAVGSEAGQTTQGQNAVAVGKAAGTQGQGLGGIGIGVSAGQNNQGTYAVAVGASSGLDNQGSYAVAIGAIAGVTGQADNSIIVNATGVPLENTTASSLVVAPIRNQPGANGVVQYNSTTKEVSYSSSVSGVFTGNIFTNLIDSADSSQIVVTPITKFESDVVVENDLTVAQKITVNGSRVINLVQLQSVVAASTDFADFQTKIAALV